MQLYLLITCSPIIVGFIYNTCTHGEFGSNNFDNENKNMAISYLVVMGIILAFFIGFRSQFVGTTDGNIYYTHWEKLGKIQFSNLPQILITSNFEKGYTLFVFVFSHFFKNGQWIFIFQGIFIAVSLSIFLYRNCHHLCLAYMAFMSLGLFHFMTQGIRQTLAMCICLFALEKVKDRKFFVFLILVGLATLFHGSAIVIIPIYFFYGINLNSKNILLIILGLIAFFYLTPYLFKIVNIAISDDYKFVYANEASGGFVTIFIFLVIIVYGNIQRNKSEENLDYDFFLLLSIATLAIFLMRFYAAAIVTRVSNYYMFGQIALISLMVEREEDKYYLVSILILLLMVLLIIHKATYSSIVPYYMFWQEAPLV